MDREDELEAFKAQIDLRAFAASLGFELDRKKSSPNSPVMRGPDGSKILIARAADGHYLYHNVHDDTDTGSIIDFVQARTRANLGEVRKTLRPWIGAAGTPPPLPAARASLPPLQPVERDILGVRARFAAMEPVTTGNRFLETERAIPASIYLHPKFAGRIRIDAKNYGNVCFAHIDRSGGITGYEQKNTGGFTGFAKAGEKRAFCSGLVEPTDTELVVCETALDLLSYAALYGLEGKRFISTAGELAPEQYDILRAALTKLPDGGRAVWAVDADKGGDLIAAKLMAVFGEMRAHERLRQERRSPTTHGQDWNDVLRETARTDASPPPPAPEGI